ncbi:MAG: 16S rRNA (adenine(1518)-N(6)/adenine(1519)-N(6))-dimethyltransferase RsmA [Fidelibacterota bacterium]
MKHTFRKKWGQNFLQDPNYIHKIIDCMQLDPSDVVIEIGPGLGALSHGIAQKVKRVVAVELDQLLIETLKTNLPENVEIVNQDFLKIDLKKLEPYQLIVGNLPYYITTPILFKVLASKQWNRCVFMIQKEVAERLFAKPGSKNYGRLSIMVQAQALIKKEFSVPPSVFYPQPSVDSTVISMKHRENLVIRTELFNEIVRLSFGQRRKKLKNTISKYLSDELLEKYGDTRPEMLSVEDFVEISNCCSIE